MANWYETKESQRTPEQAKDARIAYYQAFLANLFGRQVLADMRRRVREVDVPIGGQKSVMEIYVLDAFLRDTRALCGPVDEMAVIEAEQQAAARQPIVEVSRQTLEGFRE
jgi:crotonobetainyl-CoA:carnitine CoA-transferase CaiB-like acyl-CoA transferase